MSLFAIATYPITGAPTVNVTVTPPVSAPITIGLNGCFSYTTAGDVIRRALHHILVEAADSTLSPDEYQDGISILNSYMADMEGLGVRLGYSTVCNVSDRVTVPEAAIRGIAANLAIDLAPQFGGRITNALVTQAAQGRKTLYRLGVNVGTSSLPSTLPIAANNYQYEGNHTTSPFGVMALSGTRSTTLIAGAGQAEKIQGAWTVRDFFGFVPDVGGRITNSGEGMSVSIYAEFNLTSTVASAGGVVAVTKNNQLALYSDGIALSSTPVSALIEGTIAMEAGDFLHIYVGDTDEVNTITVIDCLVRVSRA